MKSKKGHNSKAKAKTTKPGLEVVVSPKRELHFFNSERTGGPVRLRRRLTSVTFHTAASGVSFAVSVASGSVTTATEWAALSPNYQQYRVRAVRLNIVPRNIFNNGFAATVWFPGTILGARYPSGSAASSYAGIWAEGGSQFWSESQIVKIMATMNDNPDAALFTDCNAGAPPALSQFGVQTLGSVAAPAIYNGVVTHDCFIEYDVEFISRN